MADNIQAYNRRLAKMKQKCNRLLVQYNQVGTMTKKDITKWAIIRLRAKTPIDPARWRIARGMIKNAIKAQGIKIGDVKVADIDLAAKSLVREGYV